MQRLTITPSWVDPPTGLWVTGSDTLELLADSVIQDVVSETFYILVAKEHVASLDHIRETLAPRGSFFETDLRNAVPGCPARRFLVVGFEPTETGMSMIVRAAQVSNPDAP